MLFWCASFPFPWFLGVAAFWCILSFEKPCKPNEWFLIILKGFDLVFGKVVNYCERFVVMFWMFLEDVDAVLVRCGMILEGVGNVSDDFG